MKKIKLVVPSFLALIFCMLLIAGSTFALFTSQAEASISVTSGKVKISAELSGLQLLSADATISSSDYGLAGTIGDAEVLANPELDNYRGTYYFAAQDETFANGGTAELSNAKDELTLTNMTPGDKVTLTLDLKNESNVNIKYRVKVNLVSGLKLFEALQIKLDGVLLQGVNKVGTWTYLEPNTGSEDNMSNIAVEIVLPLLAGNEYQDLSTKLHFTVEAVQGNAATTNETLNTNIEVEQQVTQVSAAQVIKDEDELVIVSMPVASLPEAATSIAVSVQPQDTVADITLTALQTAQSYDVDVLVTTTIGEQTSTVSYNQTAEEAVRKALTVQMFVGSGLTGVRLYHNTTGTEVVEFDKVNSLADLALNKFYYDSESGYVTLMTNSFSEYTVVYNKDLVKETVVNNESTFTTYKATETTGLYTVTTTNAQNQEVVENYVANVNEETNEIAVEAHTHVFGEPVVIAATCEQAGSSTITCSCGYKEVTEIAKKAHDFTSTNGANGLSHKCQNCETYEAHNWVVDQEATCTNEGSKHCSDCQYVAVINKASHEFETSSVTGGSISTCTKCGSTTADYVKKGNYNMNSTDKLSFGTGNAFPIVALNPEITYFSYRGLTTEVHFVISNVEKVIINENSYKVVFDIAFKDADGNDLELKPGNWNSVIPSNGWEYLKMYINLWENNNAGLPEGYDIESITVNNITLSLTSNANGNPGLGEYWLGSNHKDIYLNCNSYGTFVITVSKTNQE